MSLKRWETGCGVQNLEVFFFLEQPDDSGWRDAALLGAAKEVNACISPVAAMCPQHLRELAVCAHVEECHQRRHRNHVVCVIQGDGIIWNVMEPVSGATIANESFASRRHANISGL